MLRQVGVAVKDCTGRRLFGGHSMRVTGARFWTGRGLEVFKVQIFARWGSAVILRYVADVPVADLTGEMTSGSALSSRVPHADGSGAARLEEHIQSALEQCAELRALIERVGQEVRPSYVQNSSTKKWHRVLVGGTAAPPALWRTHCGWPFATATFSLHSEGPTGVQGTKHICGTCFPPGTGVATVMASDSSGSSD